jgi:hypothetical protein
MLGFGYGKFFTFVLYIFQYLLQLKGDEHATIDKPPNHKLFDLSNAKISPVMQCRLDNQNTKNAPAPSIINVSFGKEFVNMLQGPPLVQADVPTSPQTAPRSPPCTLPRPTYDMKCPTLLPANRAAGPDMPVTEFCATYDLTLTIQDKLVLNGYLHARFLRFITIDELKQMEFLFGEIAAMRDAVDRWSSP